MISLIKKIINSFLSKFNIKIVKLDSVSHHDLTDTNCNFLSAQYLARSSHMILKVELADGRTNRFFNMSSKSLDPRICAIRDALKKGLRDDALCEDILTTLEENRSLTTFKNVADLLDLELDNCENLKNFPWWTKLYPWDNRTLDNMLKYFPYEVKKNRNNNGANILSDDPDQIMKEDLENSLPSHAMQYANLVKQIINKGFRYGANYGYVSAEVFVTNNKIRWKPGKDGNHRAEVAAAMNMKTIPVLVTKIIRLEELEYWPNVKNGIFNKDQASKVFHSIFDAKPSRIHNKWIKNYLDKI